MAEIVTRKDIVRTLESWKRGDLKGKEVYEWAVQRYATSSWEPEDEFTNEILGRLDMLNMNLVTTEDIPALLAFLSAKSGFDDALKKLESYEASIDKEVRKSKCERDLCMNHFINDRRPNQSLQPTVPRSSASRPSAFSLTAQGHAAAELKPLFASKRTCK